MIKRKHNILKSIIRTVLVLAMLLPFLVSAQNTVETDLKLADQFYENNEVEKALSIYEEIYEKTSFFNTYKRILEIYIEQKDFKKAEDLVKKRIKSRKDSYRYYVDLGLVYREEGDEKKAGKSFEDAIKEVTPAQSYYITLANDFAAVNEYDYAIEVYKNAQRTTGKDLQYNFQLANMYGRKGEIAAMINEYMDILAENESYIQSIQNVLQTILNPNPNGEVKEILRTNLLTRIQKQPEKTIFSELLIWQYIQEKNFNGAFIQAKAIDKRLSENGTRIYSLGRLALSNEEYDIAINCYQYIIDKGRPNLYYNGARINLVDAIKEKIIHTENYTAEELQEVNKSYKSSLSDLGKNRSTVELMNSYAHFLAFYLDSLDAAVSMLNEAIEMPGAPRPIIAEAKIELADVLLILDDRWEASLLYSQVEKEFKYDEIGERAKFKNAKISYYSGDFLWSQAQLNALKGSTSKLISNDAIELSLLITDNIGLDSIADPLEMYARAELLLFQNKADDAKVVLDSIPQFFPASSLNDELLYLHYKIDYKKGNYENAASSLRKLIGTYATDILGDDGHFYLAKLLEEKLDQPEEAMELYKLILTNYSNSIHVVEARKHFRSLRGDTLN
ncbi:tetratricopeptide repeat protein [Vicingaceae bacterium]|nr:tetratricopeptide repeat protein [Vicingaceae bacterium]